jgi:hypothetical protein
MKIPSGRSALQRPIPAMPAAGLVLNATGGPSCEPVIMGNKVRRAKPRDVKTRR